LNIISKLDQVNKGEFRLAWNSARFLIVFCHSDRD
jgi:hypothetical protein